MEWINIEEQLPPFMETILFASIVNGKKCVVCGWNEGKENEDFWPSSWEVDWKDEWDIVAWTPLPEYPKTI